ncbi:MAG: L-lactate dehydrogenase, partial [Alphaproteobacteria bacterium]|nr:L-lactate dehydrogenase [Alphaproteobacteria bacterium]
MIVSSTSDYRKVAQRKLPRFLFDYIDGGANAEDTLQANVADLRAVNLKQRVLKNVCGLNLATEWFGERSALPVILGPVGLSGMFARRGEVQAARAAATKGVPYVLSTLSICSLEEVAAGCPSPIWFQLYVLKDRGFMQSMLERAQNAGVNILVFTVDLPVHGSRYRDAQSGLSGPFAGARRMLQAM